MSLPIVPDRYSKSGKLSVMLRNYQWNRLVMEIPHLPNDQVSGISIVSLMYSEEYNFSTQYAAFSDDISGGLPVGIQTKLDFDIPYWLACVLHNFKKNWGTLFEPLDGTFGLS